jgi:hypothetical protein
MPSKDVQEYTYMTQQKIFVIFSKPFMTPGRFFYYSPGNVSETLYSFFERGLETEFRIVAGILRVSTKYDVQYLRQRAISFLTEAYPSTLDAWDRRELTRKISGIEHTPFAALQLVEEFGISQALPAVLYCCSMRPIDEILDGSRVEIGTANRRTCLIAKQKLEEAQRKRVFAFLGAYQVTACSNPSTCNTRRLEWSARMGLNPKPLARTFDWINFSIYVCRNCLTFSRASFDEARQKLWEELPGFFNLPSWTQLLQS